MKTKIIPQMTPEQMQPGVIDLQHLDFLEDVSTEEIDIEDVLDYIPIQNKYDVFAKIIGKLRYGGQIYIRGIDLLRVSMGVQTGVISTQDYNMLVFGQNKGSISHLEEMTSFCKQHNLEITKASLDNTKFSYYLIAKRPKPHADDK